MAYQVDKFNGTFLVSVQDGTVDSTTDLRLLGKNYAGYGEVQNENFLHLLENFANTSPPPKAINGQIWFDSGTKRLKYYDQDNNKWRTTGGLEVSQTAPTRMNTGDFWYDTSADQLYSWNGNSFVLIGPQPTVGGSQSATQVAIVRATDGLNYNIVKMLAGAGDVVAIISNDEFTLNNGENPIPGFGVIKKGVTLVNADAVTGETDNDTIMWGTAADADRLGGVQAADYITKTNPVFDSTVSFSNSGYTVGRPGNNLAVFVGGSGASVGPIIESRNSQTITVRIRESLSVAHDLMKFLSPQPAIAGAVIPGLDSSYNLGTPTDKWDKIYANEITGDLIGDVTGDTTGSHRGNLRGDVDDPNGPAFDSATKDFRGTNFYGTFRGNLVGDVTGDAANALTLNGLEGSIAATSSTVALRDASGNITANRFVGTANNADALLVGTQYRSASTSTLSDTIVVRDANGNINANNINATATAANALLADAAYRIATVSPVGDTIVVRDAAGNIAVNGIIGSASSADQLQVDGTSYRLASVDAISNTIAARDANGALRATSFEATPIGTATPAGATFTTLTAQDIARINATTPSTSTNSGALVVQGGLGVGQDVYAQTFRGAHFGNTTGNVTGNLTGDANGDHTGTFNGIIGNDTPAAGTFTTMEATGVVELSGGIAASSPTTGTLRVDGGIGAQGNIYITGTLTEQSSIAYKENVNPITEALDLVNKLSGVTYDRKDKTAHSEAGFIAEEVFKVIPNVVSTNEKGGAEGVQYTKLTAYLVEAVKALTQEVNELKARLK